MSNHPLWHIATGVEAAGAVGQDRVAVVPCDAAAIVVVADGAGGSGDGARAADSVMDAVREVAAGAGVSDIGRGLYWQDALMRADRVLAGMASGETTAVVVVLMEEKVVGASVGDSQAWLVAGRDVDVLTERQRRKPLIGDGGAMPVAFECVHLGRTLLVGSDGLFNYVPLDRVLQIVASAPAENAPSALIDAARLRSGALQDDTCVAIARHESR